MPTRYTSSADTHAMVTRIAPSMLKLLGDGLPRSRKAIIAALAGRHAKDEAERTLMRRPSPASWSASAASTPCRWQPSQSKTEP